MAGKLTAVSYFALVFLLLSLAAHITGLVTSYWCIGEQDISTNSSGSIVTHVHFGLHKQVVEFKNGTIVESETWLRMKEEQYVIVAIAGLNTLLCLVLYIKAIHVVVGISSFIMLTLTMISAIYTFDRTYGTVRRMQQYHSDWPELALAWSFACVFAGLVVNIISAAIFLSILLIKGQRKESRSSKGLGPPADVKDDDDKVPIVSIIAVDHAYENVADNNDMQMNLKGKAGSSELDTYGKSHPTDITIFSVRNTDKSLGNDIHNNVLLHDDSKKGDTYKQWHRENCMPIDRMTDLDAVVIENVNEAISTITESTQL